MPQPGEVFQPKPSAEDSLLDLLVETLEGLDEEARAQFLRQFFRTIAQVDLTEKQSSEYWIKILERRKELATSAAKNISLRTAMVDVLSSMSSLRVPVLVEYDEFKKLQINAATDALTGLYNRRLFDEYLDKELNRAKRYGQQLAVAILDLHKLKEVNDRFGHLQGDHVLEIAATTLRTTLRASDFAFRIGGDEFALLLPQTDTEQAVTLCRRVRAEYENQLRPLKMDVGVTLDFGVAVHPHDGDQKSGLLSVADQRLYALKHSTRTPPRVVPIAAEPPHEAVPASSTPRVAPPAPAPGPSVVREAHTERRKWERVSLAGTKAHAVFSEGSGTARVIDLSYGGVALALESEQDLPEQFNAVLHVPILPPVRVVLRRVSFLRSEGDRLRLGCSFVS
ncbi:MAG TPA: diguanylate cyclase [Candidatus Acidoferrales bacterium]|nr:diguanylate cyclase [Candidatus Acidoferrales bacterium]